jgi:hypothetical protein
MPIILEKQNLSTKLNEPRVVQTPIEIKKEIVPLKMIPSVKDLQNALKGLKKPNNL